MRENAGRFGNRAVGSTGKDFDIGIGNQTWFPELFKTTGHFSRAVARFKQSNHSGATKEAAMAQKVIEIVGSSKESFAKAAENAVAEAAKTVRGMK